MHNSFQTAIFRKSILLILLLISVILPDRRSDMDKDFKWQNYTSEVDSLPFKQAFIDSLKNTYGITAQEALRNMTRMSFSKNETLVYEVSWGPFFAGNLILTSSYDSVNNSISLGGKAISSNFVGIFYRMRDYALSTIDASGLYPVFFEEHIREGKKYKRDSWMVYDLNMNKLHAKHKSYKLFDAPKFTHDYLSVVYYIRNMKMSTGDTFSINLFINSKIYPMFFSCKEKEQIRTENGRVNTIRIVPTLVGEGRAFNKKDKLEVWMSDDSIPTPFYIKSKIRFGSVNAKLVWHNHPITHISNEKK